jgi:CRP/FNR family transcriptional regulator, cyclic AMP receptor protein
MMQALRFMTDDERSRLVERASELRCAAGDVVIESGIPQESIYLLREGTVEIVVDDVLVDRVGQGESFGEMSFLDVTLTNAMVRAESDVVLDVLELAAIADLLEEEPELARNLYHSLAVLLAQRLRNRTSEFVKLARLA